MPDNAGVAPDQEPIVPDGPAAYLATIPVKKLALELRAAGIPAAVSNSAGTYVCNDVMYTLLRLLSEAPGNHVGGFVHVPLAPVQAAERTGSAPSMAPETAADGLAAIIRALAR